MILLNGKCRNQQVTTGITEEQVQPKNKMPVSAG
jgi:hypothetical protein